MITSRDPICGTELGFAGKSDTGFFLSLSIIALFIHFCMPIFPNRNNQEPTSPSYQYFWDVIANPIFTRPGKICLLARRDD